MYSIYTVEFVLISILEAQPSVFTRSSPLSALAPFLLPILRQRAAASLHEPFKRERVAVFI